MIRRLSIALFCFIAAGIWTADSMNQIAQAADARAVYSNSIDRLAARSKSKVFLVNSESENLRRAGLLYCLKAEFLSVHKEDLLRDLAGANVGPDPHAIEVYLTERFFQAVKSGQAMLAKAKCLGKTL